MLPCPEMLKQVDYHALEDVAYGHSELSNVVRSISCWSQNEVLQDHEHLKYFRKPITRWQQMINALEKNIACQF